MIKNRVLRVPDGEVLQEPLVFGYLGPEGGEGYPALCAGGSVLYRGWPVSQTVRALTISYSNLSLVHPCVTHSFVLLPSHLIFRHSLHNVHLFNTNEFIKFIQSSIH